MNSKGTENGPFLFLTKKGNKMEKNIDSPKNLLKGFLHTQMHGYAYDQELKVGNSYNLSPETEEGLFNAGCTLIDKGVSADIVMTTLLEIYRVIRLDDKKHCYEYVEQMRAQYKREFEESLENDS